MTSRYSTKLHVHFAEFRIHEQRRGAVSNASPLGDSGWLEDCIQHPEPHGVLDANASRDVFPKVEHIERFNVRSGEARGRLADAEKDLCTIGMS